MATEIRVPTLGESVTEATIGKWLKKPGETVAVDEPLVELETDKVSVEVPAPQAGSISEIIAEEGETVEVGALIAQFEAGSAGNSDKKKTEEKDETEKSGKSSEKTKKSEKASETGRKTSSKSSGKLVDVNVPSAGESVTEAQVGEIYKKTGDRVKVDEAILELETDKAAQEVLAPVGGVIREMKISTGDEVEVGALLLRIEEGAEAGADSDEASRADSDGEKAEDSDSSQAGKSPSPAAAKLLKEHDISQESVSGSGKEGQVLKGDVLAAIERGTDSEPAAETPRQPAETRKSDETGEREERVKMTRLRQTIARRLKDAQNSAAMLTTFNEVDMSAVMDLRKRYKDLFEKKHGVKLGFMGFFSKAVCHALHEIPAVNAEIDGTDIIYKKYCHIGVAVGTEKGLVVPVIRDADQMSIAEIEKAVGEMGRKARDGELQLADMQGGTFTISNGGVYGSLMSTPILNAPQSGILGMHKIQERPMAVNGEVKIRPMMYLALSYDHRIVDGKEAVTFLVRVKESLEDPERLVLDL
jgi:2-oxoglutarate dehydrogenase E2 component (dihydrolipoamide succinyltransferase)